MKKITKLFFCWKNDAQISRVAVVKKAPSPWKNLFSKRFFQLICADMISKTLCGNILSKLFSRYLSFGDFTVPKNKNWWASQHRFGDNYLTNHHVKFLQDRIKPWRVGALRVCTGYHFFLKKVVSEGFLTFNFSRGSC